LPQPSEQKARKLQLTLAEQLRHTGQIGQDAGDANEGNLTGRQVDG
jgi:hypothetical protein